MQYYNSLSTQNHKLYTIHIDSYQHRRDIEMIICIDILTTLFLQFFFFEMYLLFVCIA